jgi:hypothetical protein
MSSALNEQKNKISSDLYEVKGVFQPRSYLMKDENVDLLADSRNILNREELIFLVIECV